ncbi:hypothetical protein LMH87_002764 [Akanthomyces muscarius]|uniref:Uncharacterized protein n=1 Tax=Akanthomyces muscarius TaxID=2231603 RepID=A0A9W8UIV8_AKAMU|nr:hypothetical protein LMH87_002764 [Akanthomyces muscarius]KAJ4148285.1 hypothetical protein LMH87_002764 [Akanthomyces muscarius]
MSAFFLPSHKHYRYFTNVQHTGQRRMTPAMNERNRTISASHHHHGHHPPPLQRARAGTASASAPAYQSSSHAQAAPTTSRDRTNLFRSHLTRRPTGAAASSSSASSATAAAATAAQVDAARLAAEEQQLLHAELCEIVVRNQNGDIDLEGSPVVSFDDIDEMALEARQETEHERQRLAEAVKQHRINHTTVPDQPEELLEAVRASLRAKVDALAEDDWMFEPGEPPRG